MTDLSRRAISAVVVVAWTVALLVLFSTSSGRSFLLTVHAQFGGHLFAGVALLLITFLSGMLWKNYSVLHSLVVVWLLSQALIRGWYLDGGFDAEILGALNGMVNLSTVPVLCLLAASVAKNHEWRVGQCLILEHSIKNLGRGREEEPNYKSALDSCIALTEHLGIR